MRRFAPALLLCFAGLTVLPAPPPPQKVTLRGVKQPIEILRDRWGVPHIYANSTEDLFFAQGYITARDRLFQLDLWRRQNSGHLAEVLGPAYLEKDRLARLLAYRGNMEQEWSSYAPDARQIVTAFTDGINAYIASLEGRRTPEFAAAGYDPGKWRPEDCLGRVAVLSVMGNVARELMWTMHAAKYGVESQQALRAPFPDTKLALPRGLDPADITPELYNVVRSLTEAVTFEGAKGSNNWVVDGTMTATGKPLLANDPHRAITIPSLRKTVHLVAPGWNAIGAGEPALPGIALGHNESIAFGFTIVGIDQQDLYVEKLNPADPNQYRYRGQWLPIETEQVEIPVKGRERPAKVALRFTRHGPVIHEDRARNRAYSLKWIGAQPGAAGYLSGLTLARARNWAEFSAAVPRFKTPSENLVYADTQGNIGWYAVGQAPVRPNWTGLYPVPGDTGEYEWNGYVPSGELPHLYNPREHYVATANHNILPADYPHRLGYEWGSSFRFDRIRQMLEGRQRLTITDFERMQNDVTSAAAQRFVKSIQSWKPEGPNADIGREIQKWNANIAAESRTAAVYEVWFRELQSAMTPPGAVPSLEYVLDRLQSNPDPKMLQKTFQSAIAWLRSHLGEDSAAWRWGQLHQVRFTHPLGRAEWSRGPLPRSGDGTTVNAASGAAGERFPQTAGASYREIFDVSDWDRSVVINTPGESGDPASPHYSDLLDLWNKGQYHPLPYSRKAVEAATAERLLLVPPEASR